MATNQTTYIHPSITSTITDNSTVYVTSDGTTKLFAVFTSEKGEDNVIKLVTSTSEYEFHYGEPNMKLYGQIGYNIVNWLNAGGSVYCLRVLPEDAGYANAIVNIQTKVSSKEVYNIDKELVTIDNVTLRPVITYTSVNNVSVNSLEFNELRRSANKTLDGYTNNMLFAVVPKGRGKGYNNLGFRFYLEDAYDNTYDFRCYNFEVIKINDTNATSTIEGPFLVSLDPDALSSSGESLFIETVVAKYSQYFSVIFNEDNYEKLGAIINPDVNPNKIDFISGVTRKINDVNETFYCDKTGQDEDIHISLIKYDADNQPTSEINIIDGVDNIQSSIVGIDNAYRNKIYKRYQKTYEHMQIALSKTKKANGLSNPLKTYLSSDVDTLTNSTIIADDYTDLDSKITALTSDVNNTNYTSCFNSVKVLKNDIEKYIDDIYYIYDHSKIDGDSTESIQCLVDLNTIENTTYTLQNYSVQFANLSSKVLTLTNNMDSVLLDNISSEKEEYLDLLITDINDILSVLNSVETEDYNFADNTLVSCKNNLEKISNNYKELIEEYIIDEDYKSLMDEAYNTVEDLLSDLKFAINLTLLEVNVNKLKQIETNLSSVKTNVLDLIKVVFNKIDNSSYDVNDIKTNITLFKTTLATASQNTYIDVLQDFNSYVSLLYGSDGSIEGLTYLDSAVEKLIVKGYKGTIDDTLLDKEMHPIDVVLDANYSTSIKNAIVTLTTDIRSDFIAILDTKCQATPEQAVAFRKNYLSVSDYKVSIFTQDFVVEDTEYTGLNMQVTTPYFLASKIPTNDKNNGIHYNFVGPRRGVLTGFKSISFIPNPEWKEALYKAQVNYVEQDTVSTRLGSQLTSQTATSALSNISCVRALLRIQREVESMMKNYQFEWNDDQTRTEAQTELNNYLSQWVSNRCCDSISGTVYASDYDRQQKIMRVAISMIFNSIIERIFINIAVNK